MARLQDGFGRRFHYLRLSVTEVCNFRCSYCLPNGYRKTAAHDFLTADEVGRLARAFVGAGIGKVRLTGGEPSVRKDLAALIEAVVAAGVVKVCLTTNGWSLNKHVQSWAEAGLNHLNVSVDSFSRDAFARITGHDRLPAVLAGVDQALSLGLGSVKLNAVLLRETLADGFDACARFIADRPIIVRYIELMRTGDNAAFFAGQHVSGAVLRDWLLARGWTPTPRGIDSGPAREYAHPDFQGRFGVIEPYAPGFCDSCNRLRVTARGKLRLCLFGDGGIDLRDLLLDDAQEAALMARIQAALGAKAVGHNGETGATRHLAEVGG